MSITVFVMKEKKFDPFDGAHVANCGHFGCVAISRNKKLDACALSLFK